MKNTLLFTYSTNILVRLLTVNMKNCLTPKNPKMCDPILVTLLKMRPHCSQSSRENATPSSATSPLASYKKVPPPPRSALCVDPRSREMCLFVICLSFKSTTDLWLHNRKRFLLIATVFDRSTFDTCNQEAITGGRPSTC